MVEGARKKYLDFVERYRHQGRVGHQPVLARRMLERLIAIHGKQTVPWFTADEAYGDNPGLRTWLEGQDINRCGDLADLIIETSSLHAPNDKPRPSLVSE